VEGGAMNKEGHCEKIVPFRRGHGKPRTRHFIRVDTALMEDERLSPEEKFCWIAIKRFVNKDGYCWPTGIQIGKLCNCHERAVNDKIRALKKAGWLDWTHFRDKWGHKRNKYIFTIPEVVSLQQSIAIGQQQHTAVKVDTDTLYGDNALSAPPPTLQSWLICRV
jgi:hypothetical protein